MTESQKNILNDGPRSNLHALKNVKVDSFDQMALHLPH